MNLAIRTRLMKIVFIRLTPASGPLRGTAGQEGFSMCKSRKPPLGVPSEAAFIAMGKEGLSPKISEYYDFLRRCSITI